MKEGEPHLQFVYHLNNSVKLLLRFSLFELQKKEHLFSICCLLEAVINKFSAALKAISHRELC